MDLVVSDDLVSEFPAVGGPQRREILDLRFLFEHVERGGVVWLRLSIPKTELTNGGVTSPLARQAESVYQGALREEA